MKQALITATLLLGAFVVLPGCDTAQTRATTGFAPGAFPPTLSDTDYHRDSWTRDDCRTCHDTGVDKAPKTVHASLPLLAKDSKCRTCHVFIAGSEPR